MPIRASSGRDVARLVASLSADSPVTRETAVARLRVIGTRAVDRLVESLEPPSPTVARIAALRALEGIADVRALDRMLAAIDDQENAVALTALSAAGTFLHGARSADVVDRFTSAALDRSRSTDVRLAAIDALSGLTSATLKPLWKALVLDADATVRARAQGARGGGSTSGLDPADQLATACEGALPDDPRAVQQMVTAGAHLVALPVLQCLVERIRERETSEPAARRIEWTTTRAAVHVALAKRGSRLALYDVRESLERAAAPLPVEFLAALSLIGDQSCLEAIAAAFVKSAASNASKNDWWRQHLATAFRSIINREGLTRRHAVVKKIRKRWNDAVRDLIE